MKIKGKEEFLAQIGRLPDAIRREVRKALEESAEETTELMKRFVPVDTGQLRASIGWNFGAPGKGSKLATPARSAKGESDLAVVMYAGDDIAYYARFQEFGTNDMPANPFFYPGYRFGRKRAKPRLARAMSRGAKKAFKK